MREVYGCTLDKVFEINVVEFLNLVCYIKDKNELEIAQIKKIQRKR